MMANLDRYIEQRGLHGECDICRLDGSINRVVGGRHLCRGCIEMVDARADSHVMDADGEFDDIEEAFAHVVDENVGMDVVLHFARVEDSPTHQHTYTVRQAVSVETEYGDENTVSVETVDGSTETFSGIGLTVAGASL